MNKNKYKTTSEKYKYITCHKGFLGREKYFFRHKKRDTTAKSWLKNGYDYEILGFEVSTHIYEASNEAEVYVMIDININPRDINPSEDIKSLDTKSHWWKRYGSVSSSSVYGVGNNPEFNTILNKLGKTLISTKNKSIEEVNKEIDYEKKQLEQKWNEIINDSSKRPMLDYMTYNQLMLLATRFLLMKDSFANERIWLEWLYGLGWEDKIENNK